MKPSVLLIAAAVAASAFVAGTFYASRAWSQPRIVDVAVYTPIGVAQTPTGTHTIAWVLDTTNRRVVVCMQKLNEPAAAKMDCRSGDLPRL